MRTACSPQADLAVEYFAGVLASFGYEVDLQSFKYPWKYYDAESKNIVVTKTGRSSKQIIVGAHYDSVYTGGVDDNGSGVSVVLEVAKRLFGVDTPYTIVFILFGSEEVGYQGSKAYAQKMSEEDVANTICMINLDSVFAGTYRYVYSGTVATSVSGEVLLGDDSKPVVELAWPFEQAMQISKELGLEMRSNETELNHDYPPPTTGNWSDHASFRKRNIPYLYLEAANWELPDDPQKPEKGSSSKYETEIGPVMHDTARDELAFIEKQWGSRGKDNLKAYTRLLLQLVKRLNPEGLLA